MSGMLTTKHQGKWIKFEPKMSKTDFLWEQLD